MAKKRTDSGGKTSRRKKILVNIVSTVVIAVAIVVVAVYLTVYFVDDFNTVSDLTDYVKGQY